MAAALEGINYMEVHQGVKTKAIAEQQQLQQQQQAARKDRVQGRGNGGDGPGGPGGAGGAAGGYGRGYKRPLRFGQGAGGKREMGPKPEAA
jgi:hypothetical protein